MIRKLKFMVIKFFGDLMKPHFLFLVELRYYHSLPPVSKLYGVSCLMTTAAYYLQLYHLESIALDYSLVIKKFQLWRLITNFFFLGPFSFPFAFRLIIIAKYGVSLERGPFDKRTADYVWMLLFGALSLLVMAVVPYFWTPFMGRSLVFMIVYIWGREFPNARINIYGVVSLKPYSHKLVVAYWGEGIQFNSPVQRDPSAGTAFRGRSYRLNATRTSTREGTQTQRRSSPSPPPAPPQQRNNQDEGVAFRGRSYRLSS
ncbi:derlin-1.1-like isoform X1 [Cucumis melo var. makuwa]|uniref:Derlin n=1 Tax=Cucumis melo var. makuwa TaxID=1194695 RepID=A0A5D3CZG2_CUCMM|nr:derlin-1.1-like isoform X1 [Cucumis melo var. makuwa]